MEKPVPEPHNERYCQWYASLAFPSHSTGRVEPCSLHSHYLHEATQRILQTLLSSFRLPVRTSEVKGLRSIKPRIPDEGPFRSSSDESAIPYWLTPKSADPNNWYAALAPSFTNSPKL